MSTDATGRVVYFATSLSQRGSGQAAVSKVFSLRDGELTLIDQSPAISGPNAYSFPSTALDANGDVRVVNRSLSCFGGSSCFFRELARTSIQTGSGTLAFGASAALTANGRFAALFGNTNQAPGVNLPPHSVQLLDLQSGQLTLAGSQAAQSGRIVSEDGTVLIAAIIGPDVQLVGPNRKIDLTPVGRMNQASLAGDASRIVYDQSNPRAMLEIEVLDVASGVTRPLGPGYAPVLAQDGRTFSYLKTSDFSSQVWMGDALTGSARALSNEVEGIFEQTIGGNGARVIAATATGRLLSIDTASGSVTQLLDPPPPGAGLLTAAVPGSYNVLQGRFPDGFVVDLRVGGIPAIVLGPSPRGIAIQIPWETLLDPDATMVLSSPESTWERVLFRTGVFPPTGGFFSTAVALPVGAGGPGGSAYYALHQDWSGPVTGAKRAIRGEVIHMYGTGYGPVDGTIVSGKPTPSDRPYRMTSACVWKAIGVLDDPRLIDAPFAGLAPGLIGLYQFDFRIPLDWPYPLFNAYCEFASGDFLPTSAVYFVQLP